MAIFGSTHLIFFSIIACSTSTLFISSSSASELATEICKNTTDFAFCIHAIYSDPRASDADRYVLAYIAFGQTYLNATDTYKYINAMLRSIESSSSRSDGGKSKSGKLHAGLKKCRRYYAKAVRALTEMLGDLDSETFYGLDKLALDVDGCARACEARFHGHSPMSNRNENLIKLSNISLVVSKLYPYSG